MPQDVLIGFGLILEDNTNMIRYEYFKYYLNDAVLSAERIILLVILIFHVLQHYNDFFEKVQTVRHTVKDFVQIIETYEHHWSCFRIFMTKHVHVLARNKFYS